MPAARISTTGERSGGTQNRPTADISGTGTLDRRPLADGEISFVQVSEGVNEVLPIKAGKFSGKPSLGSVRCKFALTKW